MQNSESFLHRKIFLKTLFRLLFLDSVKKERQITYFLRLKATNCLTKWSDLLFKVNQLTRTTFIKIRTQNSDAHIHHYFLYVCERLRERAELSWALAFSLAPLLLHVWISSRNAIVSGDLLPFSPGLHPYLGAQRSSQLRPFSKLL